MRKPRVLPSDAKKTREIIENRKYVNFGNILIEDRDFKEWKSTHCEFCKKRSELFCYFSKIPNGCRECIREMDPGGAYLEIKKMKGFKIPLK